MPLYNVKIEKECLIVVEADDENHAHEIALENAREAFSDCDAETSANVRGEVTSEKHLREGWDGMCIPYGGDGNTRINELIPNV